jgi:hypothetical protein
MRKPIDLPTKGIPAQVSPHEIHAATEPSDRQVWAVCPYVNQMDRCRGCPSREHDAEFVEIQRGCRAMAEEACKALFAAGSE